MMADARRGAGRTAVALLTLCLVLQAVLAFGADEGLKWVDGQHTESSGAASRRLSEDGSTTATGGSFWGAFFNSVGMIIATEIGDKTFFLAAIMAMQHDRLIVFSGALSALAVMTVLSAALGFALPNILPREYTHYASACLFLYFGAKMIKEGMEAEGSGPSEELLEVEEELLGMSSKKDAGNDIENAGKGRSPEVNGRKSTSGGAADSFMSTFNLSKAGMAVLSQSFTMTFLAEWGDRSQIATIALAAAKDVFGVTIGGIIGHAGCTGMAVMGGRMLAEQISERTVHFAGGALFLLFGMHSMFYGV